MRTQLIAIALVTVFAVSAVYGQSTCSDPGGGPAQLCLDNDRLICAQDNPVSIAMPNATRTAAACTTVTINRTDICQTTAAVGAIPCAGGDGKLSSDWLPAGSGGESDGKVAAANGDGRDYLSAKLGCEDGLWCSLEGAPPTQSVVVHACKGVGSPAEGDVACLDSNAQVPVSILPNKVATRSTDAAPGYLFDKLEPLQGVYSQNNTLTNGTVQVGLTVPRLDDVSYLVWLEGGEGLGAWNIVSAGVLERATNGTFAGFVDTDITPQVGDRVLVGPGAICSTPSAKYGLYVVTDVGSESTKAQLTRTTDANTAAAFAASWEVYVQRGNRHGGNRARLVGATVTLDTTPVCISLYQSVAKRLTYDSEIGMYDTTVNNVSTATHGFAPKLSGNATDALRGDGTWGPMAGAGVTWPSTRPYLASRAAMLTGIALLPEGFLDNFVQTASSQVPQGQQAGNTSWVLVTGVPGIMRCSLGAAANQSCVINVGYAIGLFNSTPATQAWYAAAKMSWNSATSATSYAAIYITDGTRQMALGYWGAQSTTYWGGGVAQAGTWTWANSTVTVDSTRRLLELYGTGGDTLHMLVDGVEFATLTMPVAAAWSQPTYLRAAASNSATGGAKVIDIAGWYFTANNGTF